MNSGGAARTERRPTVPGVGTQRSGVGRCPHGPARCGGAGGHGGSVTHGLGAPAASCSTAGGGKALGRVSGRAELRASSRAESPWGEIVTNGGSGRHRPQGA